MTLKARTRNLWCFPWGYKEGFWIVDGLFLTGLLLEANSGGKGIAPIVWPYNLFIGIAIIGIIVASYLLLKKNTFIIWMGSVPASICAICFFTFLMLLMGTIPQNPSTHKSILTVLGFDHITSSWPFALSQIFFLLTLGFATVKRTIPFRKANWGYLLNHAGLWITLTAATLGAGDMQRLMMVLYEKETVWYATDKAGKQIELPLAVELQDFSIEEYPPKLAIVENQTSRITEDKNNNLQLIESGKTYEIGKWNIKVEKFFSESDRVEENYFPVNKEGAAPSALVTVTNANGKMTKGWITCGSFAVEHKFLNLDNTLSLAMTVPQPKKFSSKVRVYTKEGKNSEASIEVNKPFKAAGWNLYQVSYDDRFGKWSQKSVIELVKDPWLPVVYVGIFMMILGGIYIFWVGTDKKVED